jgi:hypothetical protein
VLFLAAGLAGTLLVFFPRDPITQANCDRIREGMTQGDLETIFGVPPGNYTTGDTVTACVNQVWPPEMVGIET